MHSDSVLARWVYTFLTTFFHLFVRWFFIFSSSPPHSGLASPGVGGLSSFGASLVSEAWWCFIGSSLSSPFLRHFVHPSLLVLGWVSPSFLSASSLESFLFQSFSCSSIFHFFLAPSLWLGKPEWRQLVSFLGCIPCFRGLEVLLRVFFDFCLSCPS